MARSTSQYVSQVACQLIIIIINAFDNAPYVDVRTANRGSGQSRDQSENDSRYKCVRSEVLNCPKVSAVRTLYGSAFQTVGAA